MRERKTEYAKGKKKKSETELTAGVLKKQKNKNQKPPKQQTTTTTTTTTTTKQKNNSQTNKRLNRTLFKQTKRDRMEIFEGIFFFKATTNTNGGEKKNPKQIT